MRTRDRGAASDIALIVGIPLLILALVGGVWGVSVLLAEPVGRGEAIKQRESANNRIFANEQFERLNAEYDATLAKIDQAAAVRSTSPDAEVRLQGLQQYCASVAADYNAAARSYRTEQFRGAGLPASLDPQSCNTIATFQETP